MSIAFIHDRLAMATLLFGAICVAWGLLNYLRKQPVTSGYWGALVILQILAVVQTVVGLLVFTGGGSGGLLRPIVHGLYGATLLLSLPAAYIYSGGKDTRNENMVYALVCLWLVFITERAISTGQEGVAPALSWLLSLL